MHGLNYWNGKKRGGAKYPEERNTGKVRLTQHYGLVLRKDGVIPCIPFIPVKLPFRFRRYRTEAAFCNISLSNVINSVLYSLAI
jgi:hypothetical protein